MTDILKKIKEAGLLGRGGADYPVASKWEALMVSASAQRYLIVNGSEGEPGSYKDSYILENLLEDLLKGIKVTSDFIQANRIYFYLRSDLFDKYKNKIEESLGAIISLDSLFFIKKSLVSEYIAGEESTIINFIEGQIIAPRLKPPFPSEKGLFNQATLVHNIETLYNIALVANDNFKQERFYSINLKDKNLGVFSLPNTLSVSEILKKSGYYPDYDFFVQVGGDASGEVLNSQQLESAVTGSGVITVHPLAEHQPEALLKYYLEFFKNNSCGQCVPCREGTYRLAELFYNLGLDFTEDSNFNDLCQVLSESSFCALGRMLPRVLETYWQNVYEPFFKK